MESLNSINPPSSNQMDQQLVQTMLDEKEGSKDKIKSKKNSEKRKQKGKERAKKKKTLMQNSNLLIDQNKNTQYAIRKQLEFYFSDANLQRDKFLRQLLFTSSNIPQEEQKLNRQQVDLTIILNFERMKKLLKDANFDQKKEMIKNCLEKSKIVGIDRENNLLFRKQTFSLNQISKDQINQRMVYVENLPHSITHEQLASVFARAGKILHISIPKFIQSKKSKGFAFIEFENEEIAKKAIEELNGLIPMQFFEVENKYHIKTEGEISSLTVMSMNKWEEYKEEFKKIKRLIFQQNNSDFLPKKRNFSSLDNISLGCLIHLSNIPENSNKLSLIQLIKHFSTPEYVDYVQGSSTGIVRFSQPILADSFFQRYNEGKLNLKLGNNILIVRKIEGKEEADYLDFVKKKKRQFKEYTENKKMKKLNE